MARRKKQPFAYAYKNTLLLLVSLVILFFVAGSEPAQLFIKQIGTLGYFGAFMTGIFFVSTFTVAPAVVVLFHLAGELNPVLLSLTGGAGAAFGDLLIFRFLRDGVFRELTPLVKKMGRSHFVALLQTRHFKWLLPVIGAALIASPFPDELGIGLMGLSKIRWWQFLLLAFVLDVLGIGTIAFIARSL